MRRGNPLYAKQELSQYACSLFVFPPPVGIQQVSLSLSGSVSVSSFFLCHWDPATSQKFFLFQAMSHACFPTF